MTTRRQFLRTASLAGAAAVAMPRNVYGETSGTLLRVFGDSGHRPTDAPPVLEDPRLRELASKALDAATLAGAQYADVRFTITRREDIMSGVDSSESVAVGVRALTNGAWGFVAGPAWTEQEVTRLGAQAARQAAKNKWKSGDSIELAAISSTATGTWSTPIERDPFSVSIEEKMDISAEIGLHFGRLRSRGGSRFSFRRQERTLATTDGAFFTQLLYTAFEQSGVMIAVTSPEGKTGDRSADWISPRSAGFEALSDVDWRTQMDLLYEEAMQKAYTQPVDIGRFDIVFDGYAMAALVGASLGEPLELDRARGFEANAEGTSYLAPPLEIVGQKKIGTPSLSLRADRSMPSGAATARWDDEGVETQAFDLIKDGVVVDYSTTRQHVGFLSEYYRTHGRTARSHGCSNAASAMDFPLVATSNLTMAPGRSNTSFDNLVADLADGYAIIGGEWSMDQQGLTGQWGERNARVFRVKGGKIVAPVRGTGLFVRSLELWKNLQAIGGASSVRIRGIETEKGQPSFQYAYSVSAPAARIGNVAVTDLMRKYNG